MPIAVAKPLPVTTTTPELEAKITATAPTARPGPRLRIAQVPRSEDGGKGDGQGQGQGKATPAPSATSTPGIKISPPTYTPIQLLDEIHDHGQHYYSPAEDKAQVKVSLFPSYLDSGIKQLRANCDDCVPYPSINLLMTVVLTHGIKYFLCDDEMRDIARSKQQFYKEGPERSSLVFSVLKTMVESVPVSPSTVGRDIGRPTKLYLRVPSTLSEEINGAADSLGMRVPDIVVLATVLVLSSQERGVHADIARQCQETFGLFLAMLRCRRRCMVDAMRTMDEVAEVAPTITSDATADLS